MKTKAFKVISIFFLLGLCLTAFKNGVSERSTSSQFTFEDPFMYLNCGGIDVTNGEIDFVGTTPSEPFTNDLQIAATNGTWVIEYTTSLAQDHVGLSERQGTSDATVTITPDGTPGTYGLDFYLNSVKMATLTIVVQ
jgi:hypothetical protein